MSISDLKALIEKYMNTLKNYDNLIDNNNQQINVYQKYIEDLQTQNNNSVIKKQEIETIITDFRKQIKALEDKSTVNQSIKTIQQLLPHIQNDYQYQILTKIISDVEYSKIYLSDYEPNTDVKKKDIIGTIKILGTYNEKKKLREEYEVKIYKDSPKGTFWCNCADHKFNSSKKGTSCKHICFLVCKVMKIFDLNFFATKKLNQLQIDALIQKLTSDSLWKDSSLAKEFEKITLDTFKNFMKQLEDCCPICFNDLEENEKPILLACPTCHNYTHKECMEVWLEKQQRCVLCKSDIWGNYAKVKTGASVTKQMCV